MFIQVLVKISPNMRCRHMVGPTPAPLSPTSIRVSIFILSPKFVYSLNIQKPKVPD